MDTFFVSWGCPATRASTLIIIIIILFLIFYNDNVFLYITTYPSFLSLWNFWLWFRFICNGHSLHFLGNQPKSIFILQNQTTDLIS